MVSETKKTETHDQEHGIERDCSITVQGIPRQQYRGIQKSKNSNPTYLRSSARLSRRNQTSPSPSYSIPRRSSPSVSTVAEPEIVELGEAPLPDICLCQPDPKIPRPRNAFILFRQHHQASVVAQNPGLANPDISKIIGELWRKATEETREDWKKLAEEEKHRHSERYPDYRYQPRRAGRSSMTISAATELENQRCLKCGGKSMQMLKSLPTPGTPASPRPIQSNPIMGGNAILSRGSRYIGTPSYPIGSVERGRGHPQSSNGDGMLSLRQRDQMSQSGPELKRKRHDGPPFASPRPGSAVFPSSFSQPGRRPSMPHPEISARGNSVSVPRALPSGGRSVNVPGPVLAPLRIDNVRDAASQRAAVEAMHMSIPALRKLKVLATISPPIPLPGPASPSHRVRGALIAVEGTDEEAIRVTATYLKDYLERDGDYRVRILTRPLEHTFEDEASWLKAIVQYHKYSEEIVKFITTDPQTEVQNSRPASRRSSELSSVGSKTDSDPNDDAIAASATSSPASATDPQVFKNRAHAIPIVIVPKYQLYLTDLAASQISINDQYSPQDHWQWMATIWRRIVGPDVTIVVRTSASAGDNGSNGASNAQLGRTMLILTDGYTKPSLESPMICRDVAMTGTSTSSGGSVGGAVNQMSITNTFSVPLVDIKLQEARVVFLHGKTEGKISEAGLRRMAFEVGEWSRDIDSRERERAVREAAKEEARAREKVRAASAQIEQ